jgi:hypothetical protein
MLPLLLGLQIARAASMSDYAAVLRTASDMSWQFVTCRASAV